jgi:serine/threonine protein phosphatase PrpC
MGAKRTRLYGLNLSRCLGDKFLKEQDMGLSAQPHVSPVMRLDPCASGIVLLASDGLWDVADGTAAMQVSPAPSPSPLASSPIKAALML